MLADNEWSEHADATSWLAMTFWSARHTTGSSNPDNRGVDALLPAEIAEKAETVGVQKTKLDVLSLLALAILAGAFIALGAMFATTVLAGADGVLPFGLSRLLAGIAFCLGLILVILGGAELFTGNALMVMAWAAGKVPLREMLRAWLIVYIGNFIGATGTAALVFLSVSVRGVVESYESVVIQVWWPDFWGFCVTSWCASRCGSPSAHGQRATRSLPCYSLCRPSS
jgi:hypothetical protein